MYLAREINLWAPVRKLEIQGNEYDYWEGHILWGYSKSQLVNDWSRSIK